MKTKPTLVYGLAAALLLSGLAGLTKAQSLDLNQSINIAPGQSLEVIAERSSNDKQVSWILTQNGEFVQAKREPRFSYRSASSQNLLLTGEVAAGSESPKRAQVAINVNPGTERFRAPTANATAPLLTIEPAASNNVVSMSNDQLLKLSPGRDDIEQLFLDTNLQVDGNGNGDPADDNALSNSDAGQGTVPIYIWFTQTQNTELIAAAKLSDGQIISQRLTINFGATPTVPDNEPNQPDLTDGNIATQDLGGGKIRFEAVGNFSTTPVLLRWDFGDGEQSLLDMPVHEFRASGTYQIKVTVNDLQTGQALAEFNDSVSVTVPVAVSDSSKEPIVTPRDNDKPVVSSSDDSGGSTIWGIGLLILAIMTAMGIGILVMFIVSKLRSRSLHETIAEVEDRKFGETAPAEDQAESPPPMTLPEVEVVETENPPADATQEAAPGPSWLAPSEEAAPEAPPAQAEEVTPISEPVIEPEPTTQEPAPVTPEPTVQTTPEAAPVPEWLQPQTQAAQPAETTTPPTPPAEPVPTQSEPAPATPQEAGPTPEWLQPQATEVAPTAPEITQGDDNTAQDNDDDDRIPPEVWEAMSPEDREKERKRRKRQRYRANKREREAAEATEQPVPPVTPPTTPEVQPIPPAPTTTEQGPVPEWLQPQADAPATPPAEPTTQPSDNDVQFTVSADSLGAEPHNEPPPPPPPTSPSDYDQSANPPQ